MSNRVRGTDDLESGSPCQRRDWVPSVACRHDSQVELRIVLSVSSPGVTLVCNMMSCWYQFLEVVRSTPLCWPAPFVILNPDLRTTVLVTDTAADGRCCITTGVCYSHCSALICSYRTGPSKSEVSAIFRQAPQSNLPAPGVAEEKLRIRQQQHAESSSPAGSRSQSHYRSLQWLMLRFAATALSQ
jgi:hypothetical protein